jgi:hypothetical protein
MAEETKLFTPNGRASFVRIFQPDVKKQSDGSEKTTYSMTLIFPEPGQISPEDAGKGIQPVGAEQIQAIAAMIKAAARVKWGDKIPANLEVPLQPKAKQVNNETGERYAGYEGEGYILKCKADRAQPPVKLPNKQFITQESGLFYSGAWCRALVSAWAWEFKDDGITKRGVTCKLWGVVSFGFGEPFGSDAVLGADAMDDLCNQAATEQPGIVNAAAAGPTGDVGSDVLDMFS